MDQAGDGRDAPCRTTRSNGTQTHSQARVENAASAA